MERKFIPGLHKIIDDAEAQLLTLTGYNIELSMKVKGIGDLNLREQKRLALQRLVCEIFNVSWAGVLSACRKKDLVDARRAYMYVLVKYGKEKYSHVGKELGKDHTTVLYACKHMQDLLEVNDPVTQKVDDLIKQHYEA